MTITDEPTTSGDEPITVDTDVVVIGAGLSGIDIAYRLRERNPDVRYVILERRPRIGGTWDLFRYPGVRSDSDIFSLSYPFEPWRRPEALADGEHIRDYLVHTAHAHGIDTHMRFDRRVEGADWDSSTDTWTVSVEQGESHPAERYRCRFVALATGYYDYDHPYTPPFPDLDDFTGPVVHPQLWPEDLDYAGKRIVVIGSGATAVSLIPALARTAAHVTMLQRSPSYIYSSPQKQIFAPLVRKVLPRNAAHRVIRSRYALQTAALVHATHRFPTLGRKLIRSGVVKNLPMREHGYTHAYPHLGERSMPSKSIWDLQAGYVLRSPEAYPKSETRGAWEVRHSYYRDLLDHRLDKVDDGLVFGRAPVAADHG